jgi:hypothetical protein
MQREGQDTVNVLLAPSQQTNIPLEGVDSVRAGTRVSTGIPSAFGRDNRFINDIPHISVHNMVNKFHN